MYHDYKVVQILLVKPLRHAGLHSMEVIQLLLAPLQAKLAAPALVDLYSYVRCKVPEEGGEEGGVPAAAPEVGAAGHPGGQVLQGGGQQGWRGVAPLPPHLASLQTPP